MAKTLTIIRWSTLALTLALVTAMVVTAPDKLGPFGITVWFLGLCAVLIGTGLLLQQWLSTKPQDKFWTHLRRSVLLAVLFTATLALSSLRQLSGRDIILLVILGLVINFYMRRIYR